MKSTSHKNAATDFLKLVASGQINKAFSRYTADGFRHHNPYFKGDADSLKQAMLQDHTENPDKILDVHRAIQDGNEVAVLSRVRRNPDDPGFALVHIFRFDGDRIVELWDVGQAVPEEMVNENGMF